jgi:glucosylceramidase
LRLDRAVEEKARSGFAALALALVVSASACGGGASVHFPTPVCGADQIACGLHCVDVATDAANCGGCGVPCTTGQTCEAGACVCPSGAVDCNGACVAPDTVGCGGATGSLVVTSAPGAYWNTDGSIIEVTAGSADVTVNDADTRQIWEGFGGAFNEMGWTTLSALSEADRDAAIRLLYGADGARFAFGRIPIGASDYALERYTLDETPDDTSLADFSIERDMQALIPFVKAAQAVKPSVRLWASPWTPPTWMKEGPFSPGKQVSPFDGGKMKGDDATLAAFAQYLIRFVQAYAQQGIAIEAISPQNEPGYTGNYPTCGWSSSTYTKLVGQHLGPAVAAAGLTTKIMLGTFNGGDGDGSIVGEVMDDGAAQAYVSVLGFQWGMQTRVGGARPYHLPVWQTEHKCGNYPWGSPFDAARAPNDQAYAVESWGLIRDWIRAGVTAYSAWNMVLDTVGTGIDTTRVWPQNALLTVDTAAHTLNVTPAYYVFRHVSQFVATGAKIVATSGGDALAFRNPDGAIVVVARNEGAARTMTVAAGGRKLQLAMPGDGWATIVTR